MDGHSCTKPVLKCAVSMATAGSTCRILAWLYGEDALARGKSAHHAFFISDFAAPLEAAEAALCCMDRPGKPGFGWLFRFYLQTAKETGMI